MLREIESEASAKDSLDFGTKRTLFEWLNIRLTLFAAAKEIAYVVSNI